eukprot:3950633-Pyramimonas_sp.AAC.1
MVVAALSWGRRQTANLLLSGFYALSRPCECLELTEGDFVLPQAHLGGEVIFIRVKEAKTHRRGVRRQRARLDEPFAVAFLAARAARRLGSEMIQNRSGSAFRRHFARRRAAIGL